MRATNECRCNLQLSKIRLISRHHPIKSIYGYVDRSGNNYDKIRFNLINCKNIELQLLMGIGRINVIIYLNTFIYTH